MVRKANTGVRRYGMRATVLGKKRKEVILGMLFGLTGKKHGKGGLWWRLTKRGFLT